MKIPFEVIKKAKKNLHPKKKLFKTKTKVNVTTSNALPGGVSFFAIFFFIWIIIRVVGLISNNIEDKESPLMNEIEIDRVKSAIENKQSKVAEEIENLLEK